MPTPASQAKSLVRFFVQSLFMDLRAFKIRVNQWKANESELMCVNPKLKCHPNAQSRNVTYLRRIQSSPRRSLASIEFSLKSNTLVILTLLLSFALNYQKRQIKS